MNKYLIFRTDRIGDFLLSAIIIRSIKINDPESHLTVVASKKNYNYIKSFSSVNDVILLNNNFKDKIRLILQLRKNTYQNIILIFVKLIYYRGEKQSERQSFDALSFCTPNATYLVLFL